MNRDKNFNVGGDKMSYIDEEHKKVKEKLSEYNLRPGVRLFHKESRETETIVAIHPEYGWVITKSDENNGTTHLRQDLKNIQEFSVHTR